MNPTSIISLVQQHIPSSQSIGTSFLTSFLTILVCEIGDKTFFLAMIMAMKYNKYVVFGGAFGALALMTILSTLFGSALPLLINKFWTDLVVTGLFFYYGFKLVHEAYTEEDTEEHEELKEVEIELNALHDELLQKQKKLGSQQPTTSKIDIVIPHQIILWQAFSLTFLAQWGDRSQIATIALAASYNTIMVMIGATLGHCLCTGAAVQLGEWISKRMKIKTIHYIAGAIFILSGLITLGQMIFRKQQHTS